MSGMISESMKTLCANNSAIRVMFEEGNRLAALYGRENVYDYSLGNPYFPAPDQIRESIVDIVTHEDPNTVHGYMSNAGFPSVRQAVAENLNRRFGTDYSAENVIMTVGAAGGLNCALKCLLNPGDEVLVFAPYFLDYGNYVRNFGASLKVLPSNSETFLPDLEVLRAAIGPKTRALILNNPNNPTGVIYPREVLTALGKVLEEKGAEYGVPIYIISDEPYRELAYDGREVPWLPSCCKNVIVGYSWSKSLSLPGERIGYLLVPSDIEDFENVVQGCTIAGRVLGFVNAPSLMQLAVARCLDASADIAAYDANRKLLYDTVTAAGFSAVYPEGAFYLWMRAPGGDDKALCEKAKAYNLLLVPGSSFAGPGNVRLAYCVSPDMIRRSAAAFEKLAKDFHLK
jgi:aspartate aminotransferase